MLAMVALIIGNLGNINAAAPQTGPGSGSVALKRYSIGRMSVDIPTNVGVRITPILIVPDGSPARTAGLDAIFGDFEAGRPFVELPFGMPPETPGGYTVITNTGMVEWHSFAYAQEGHFFAGVVDPDGEFQNETGWVVNWFVELFSLDGSDSVALSDIRFSFTSNDLENSLGHTAQLWQKWYSLYARGYKQGMNMNSPIITGDGEQKAARVAVVMWSRLYNGAGTTPGAEEIRTWVGGFENFTLLLEIDLVNGFHAEAMVQTNPPEVVPEPEGTPVLTPQILADGRLKITLSGVINDERGKYIIEVAGALDGEWTNLLDDERFVAMGYTHTFPPGEGQQELYFRAHRHEE